MQVALNNWDPIHLIILSNTQIFFRFVLPFVDF